MPNCDNYACTVRSMCEKAIQGTELFSFKQKQDESCEAFFPVDLVAQIDYESIVFENNRIPEPVVKESEHWCIMCGNKASWDMFCSSSCRKDFYGV